MPLLIRQRLVLSRRWRTHRLAVVAGMNTRISLKQENHHDQR